MAVMGVRMVVKHHVSDWPAAAAAGARRLGDTQSAAYATTALIEDPSGNVIELIQPRD